MSIFNYFLNKRQPASASVAKERLQILVAHERSRRSQPDYMEKMQLEILEVIRKYVEVDQEQVNIRLDNSDDCSILELNVTLPD